MTLMSRKVDYALLILSHLHSHSSGASAREIHERFGLSHAFVANILKLLCNKGFVSSHRGVKGGYVLQRPLEEVHLTDVLDALDEAFHLTECTHDGAEETCTVESICPVRSPLARVHERIREFLARITLAELFAPCQQESYTELGLTVGSGLNSPVLPLGTTSRS